MRTITDRRHRILKLIDDGVTRNLTSPSLREITVAMGGSRHNCSPAYDDVKVLIEHGLLVNIDPGRGRRGGLRVTDKGKVFLAETANQSA